MAILIAEGEEGDKSSLKVSLQDLRLKSVQVDVVLCCSIPP